MAYRRALVGILSLIDCLVKPSDLAIRRLGTLTIPQQWHVLPRNDDPLDL